jgi:hypothetical protein
VGQRKKGPQEGNPPIKIIFAQEDSTRP